jgi:hypothetical protein
MRKVFLAALGAILLSVVFVESASAQRAWGYRGAGWGGRAIGGFYGRPFVRRGWGVSSAGFYGRPYLRPGMGLYRPGWRTAGYYGWRRPWLGWGAAGIVAGVAAASYYGYPGYGYAAYDYPAYAYSSYGYPSCGCGYRSGYLGGYGWHY